MSDKPRVLIVFSTSNAWYAKFFRWVMSSHIHHTFLWYRSPYLGWLALEIDEDGAHFVHPKKALKRVSKMECYETSYDLTQGIRAMKEYLGSGYDWRGLVSGILRLLLFKLTGYVSEHGTHSLSRMFCSELITSICQKSDMTPTDILVPAETWPPKLLETIKPDPKVWRVENPFSPKYEF